MPDKITFLCVIYRIEDGTFTTEDRSIELETEEDLEQLPEKLKDLFPKS